MYFQHSNEIWNDFPELVPGVLVAEGIDDKADPARAIAHFTEVAASRLAESSTADLPEIQAWRRTFSRMGHKPTQYRCASESLLRRFQKDGSLPRIHPAIDLCNAASLAYAIPVAVFDISKIAEYIQVQYAVGNERYQAFSGETEQPDSREVIFADGAGQAHARRWTNRQSGLSALRDTTETVLIVAEAMHESAAPDVQGLTATIAEELDNLWSVSAKPALLTTSAPRYEF